MAAVFSSLVPVFLLILTGAAVRRLLVPEAAHWVAVERLAYYVTFPVLLIETLRRADLAEVPLAGLAVTLVGAILAMTALCLALRPILASRLQLDGAAFTSVFQGATRWQTFIALAVAGNMFGTTGLALSAVAVVSMIPLLNVLNVWVLSRFAMPLAPDWRRSVVAMARNPLIWSCAVGALLNAIALPVPETVADFLDLLGGTALPVGLLLVGSGLQPESLLKPRAVTLMTTVLKLVVMPAMAIGLALAMGLSGTAVAVVACCASVPSSSSAYVLARQMGGDAPLMAEILTVQTIVAIATMPIAIAIATR